MQLTQVQVVFRHGARTPLVLIENRGTTFNNVVWDKHELEKVLDSTDIPYTLNQVLKQHDSGGQKDFINSREAKREDIDKLYSDRPKLNVNICTSLCFYSYSLPYSLLFLYTHFFILLFQFGNKSFPTPEVKLSSRHLI